MCGQFKGSLPWSLEKEAKTSHLVDFFLSWKIFYPQSHLRAGGSLSFCQGSCFQLSSWLSKPVQLLSVLTQLLLQDWTCFFLLPSSSLPWQQAMAEATKGQIQLLQWRSPPGAFLSPSISGTSSASSGFYLVSKDPHGTVQGS